MYYVDRNFTKSASAKAECDNIMQRIYDEDPSYWPNGLDSAMMDGGTYMVRSASTNEPVGFVGWQERNRGSRKIGYYSVGILNEHRRNGYAKKAVALLINEKVAGVDEVHALIKANNSASRALAECLPVKQQLIY
jgi:RimJ/RimL family protein N-acetyltransferase